MTDIIGLKIKEINLLEEIERLKAELADTQAKIEANDSNYTLFESMMIADFKTGFEISQDTLDRATENANKIETEELKRVDNYIETWVDIDDSELPF